MPELRLGVDLGETSVDAVVLDERDSVLARAKLARGEAAESMRAAVAAVTGGSAADPRLVTRAVVGSSAALEAIERPHGLRRVAVLRIGSPLTLAIPPLATWPGPLRRAVSAGETVVDGGADYDGRSTSELDRDGVMRFLAHVSEIAEAAAVTGVFSSVSPEHELEAAELVRRELGASVNVSLSHETGTIGLLERENATILHAALRGVAESLAESLGDALGGCGIDAELFFAKGDGTVMTLEHAVRFPAFMLGSGLASGMCGAAWLSGAADGVMVDVGAARTRFGTLVGGRPTERATPNELAGVRTNLGVPESITLDFGGATVVRLDGSSPAIAEESLGSRLQDEALIFGGAMPTLTDAAVAGGRGEVGTHSLTPRQRGALTAVLPTLDGFLAAAIDSSRHALPAATLVVFGGASMLVPEHMAGVSEVIVPANGDIAGAVGLLVAPAGGQADRICANRPAVRATTMDAACAEALARAIHAGADPANVHIVEVEEVPLSYLLDPPVRIRVKAVGPRI
jgi:N-methylhydantoinase A/oxoprolinase/acetone carboxylase beta subunit